MPVAMSSMRSSPGPIRLGEECLVGPEGPEGPALAGEPTVAVSKGAVGTTVRRGAGGRGKGRKKGRGRRGRNRQSKRGEKGGTRGGEKRGENVVAIVDGGSEGGALNVVAVVNSGSEGGIMDLGREKRRKSSWFGREQTDKLQCFRVRPRACNAIVFSNGFVDSGRNVKKPVVAKL